MPFTLSPLLQKHLIVSITRSYDQKIQAGTDRQKAQVLVPPGQDRPLVGSRGGTHNSTGILVLGHSEHWGQGQQHPHPKTRRERQGQGASAPQKDPRTAPHCFTPTLGSKNEELCINFTSREGVQSSRVGRGPQWSRGRCPHML